MLPNFEIHGSIQNCQSANIHDVTSESAGFTFKMMQWIKFLQCIWSQNDHFMGNLGTNMIERVSKKELWLIGIASKPMPNVSIHTGPYTSQTKIPSMFLLQILCTFPGYSYIFLKQAQNLFYFIFQNATFFPTMHFLVSYFQFFLIL